MAEWGGGFCPPTLYVKTCSASQRRSATELMHDDASSCNHVASPSSQQHRRHVSICRRNESDAAAAAATGCFRELMHTLCHMVVLRSRSTAWYTQLAHIASGRSGVGVAAESLAQRRANIVGGRDVCKPCGRETPARSLESSPVDPPRQSAQQIIA